MRKKKLRMLTGDDVQVATNFSTYTYTERTTGWRSGKGEKKSSSNVRLIYGVRSSLPAIHVSKYSNAANGVAYH